MHTCYADILSRIPEPPLWFDECAVPRYVPFAPNQCANIYAKEAVLVRIACQGCQQTFDVAFTSAAASEKIPPKSDGTPLLLRDYIAHKELHYGDPPNVECCAAGASMNSVPQTVLEYWVKPIALGEGRGCSWPPEGPNLMRYNIILWTEAMNFRRDPEFEGVDLTPDWAR